MKTRILYEDESIFVIHKPAGIAVQSGRISEMDVESELKNYQGAKAFLGLVHRLDQPVEGLLVVARTKEATASLNKQLASGSLNKKYLAIVHLEKDDIATSGHFVDFMVKDGQISRIVSLDTMKGDKTDMAKKASLRYHIVKKQEDLAMVDICIETGRFHQIRCQMAYHNMPLVGDAKYGSDVSKAMSRKEGIRQTALCANRIIFKHPLSDKLLEFEVVPENLAFTKFL